MPDTRTAARLLGGDVAQRGGIVCPGPGHGRRDRSLSVKLDPRARDGFVVYSFAGDDVLVCRDFVRERLGLGAWQPRGTGAKPAASSPSRPSPSPVKMPDEDDAGRIRLALRIWNEATDPRGTPAEIYLHTRRFHLEDDLALRVLRWHASTECMVALMRNVITDEPQGVHRTFISPDGRKLGRRMKGRAKGAAIKLDADEDVTLGLFLGEGIETCLAARAWHLRPVWAVGSAGAIGTFPVLAGLDAITVLGEHDGGANAAATDALARTYQAAGVEVERVRPLIGDDLADAWSEVKA